MAKASLPPATSPMVDPSTGIPTPWWYLAFQFLLNRTGGTAVDLVGTALHVDTNGIVVATGSGDGTAITRSIASGTGINVTNGSGEVGNPTINCTITQYTDELAQDAVGAMVDSSLEYVDGTPRLGMAANQKIVSIPFIIDGGGSTITTGYKGHIVAEFAGTITQNTLLGEGTGSIVVDIWKCSYSDFDGAVTHPAAGDKITASAPPTISGATKSKDGTLTGWTTSFSAGDILGFNVNSITTFQRVTLSLKATKT